MPEELLRIDEDEKPLNCGVTVYRGDPQAGQAILGRDARRSVAPVRLRRVHLV
jgi:hypothetical protein